MAQLARNAEYTAILLAAGSGSRFDPMGKSNKLLAPLAPHAPRQVYVTHGEPEAATAMAGHIKEAFGWSVSVPAYGDVIELR